MKRDLFLPFLNKPVKIVLEGNFALNGVINKIFDDCLEFETKQKISLIHFSRIMELTPRENNCNKKFEV